MQFLEFCFFNQNHTLQSPTDIVKRLIRRDAPRALILVLLDRSGKHAFD